MLLEVIWTFLNYFFQPPTSDVAGDALDLAAVGRSADILLPGHHMFDVSIPQDRVCDHI